MGCDGNFICTVVKLRVVLWFCYELNLKYSIQSKTLTYLFQSFSVLYVASFRTLNVFSRYQYKIKNTFESLKHAKYVNCWLFGMWMHPNHSNGRDM